MVRINNGKGREVFHNIFSNCLHIIDFDVIVHLKQKPNKWTANIEHVTLKGLKDYIRKMYHPLALENDRAELNLMNDGEKYFSQND